MVGEHKNKGTIVVVAGIGINLALGVLYTWSIFKAAIKESVITGEAGGFQWDMASLNDPYAICCLVFAFTMILAGKCQDTIGPRKTAIIGGILVGTGFVWISQTTAYLSWLLGFGVLVGAGIAFGYAAATPPAMKWFPPNKTGLIAGLVVSGFGLASVYTAPLAKYLLDIWGLQQSMLFFGIAFLIIVSTLAIFLTNPPDGFVAEGFIERRGCLKGNKEDRHKIKDVDMSPREMLQSINFKILWILYFIGAGVGLMVIGSVAGMASENLGDSAFWAVATLALGNTGGRIVAGMLSDQVGRKQTLIAVFILQAFLMFLAIPITQNAMTGVASLLFLTAFIGFNYGANLAIFPSFTKDLWGSKNFGINYGLLFTAWGVGGFVMSRGSQSLQANFDSFTLSFMMAGVLLLAGAGLTFLVNDWKDEARKNILKGTRLLPLVSREEGT